MSSHIGTFAYFEGAEQDFGSDSTRLSDAVDLVADGCIGSRWDSLAIPSLDSRSCERNLNEGKSSSHCGKYGRFL